jgi:hypothetical protein
MKKTFRFLLYSFAFASLLACSDDDNNNPDPGPGAGTGKYVLMTSVDDFGSGYLTVYDGLPSGTVQNTNAKSLQIENAFGFRTFGKWLFNRSNAAGDEGLQKFTANADGSLKDEGFIAGATQFLIINETTGYYLDETRGTLKLQKFNPTTMLRTGEIDFASLKKAGVQYQAIGKHVLAAKEGKLYAAISYGTTAGQGWGDDLYDYVEFAVIDIATDKLEKTIKYEGLRGIGWGSSGNKMWTTGDDGALYLYSTGLTSGFVKPTVIRIKKGETDFDRTWSFTTDTLKPGNSIVTGTVKGGKFYFELASEPLKVDFSTLTSPIFDYYAYDFTTSQSIKISGLPLHEYAYGNEQAILEIDGKVYLRVSNTAQKLRSYYVVDGTAATKVFDVAFDGTIQGFAKLAE